MVLSDNVPQEDNTRLVIKLLFFPRNDHDLVFRLIVLNPGFVQKVVRLCHQTYQCHVMDKVIIKLHSGIQS